ncbi:MAG: hypothetical protein M3083_16150, partial [Actinomycetota bacterium]|nr:hypothetical protein [Actinomycetota bacterium]
MPPVALSTTLSPACSDCWAYGSQRRAGSTSKTSPSNAAIEPVTVLGKGSKLALIPLPPRVARAVDMAA